MKRTKKREGHLFKKGSLLPLCITVAAVVFVAGCSQWKRYLDTAHVGKDTPPSRVTSREIARTLAGVRPLKGNPNSHYRLALHYQERGRYHEALQEFRKTVGIDPRHADALNGMGVSYDKMKRYSRAQEAYRAALQIKPDSAEILNNLGYSLYLQGNFAEAQAVLEQALEHDADNRRYRNNLALVRFERGDFEGAHEEYTRGLGKAAAHVLMGGSYYRIGRYRKAASHFSAALKVDPEVRGAKGGLGAALSMIEIAEPARVAGKGNTSLEEREDVKGEAGAGRDGALPAREATAATGGSGPATEEEAALLAKALEEKITVVTEGVGDPAVALIGGQGARVTEKVQPPVEGGLFLAASGVVTAAGEGVAVPAAALIGAGALAAPEEAPVPVRSSALPEGAARTTDTVRGETALPAAALIGAGALAAPEEAPVPVGSSVLLEKVAGEAAAAGAEGEARPEPLLAAGTPGPIESAPRGGGNPVTLAAGAAAGIKTYSDAVKGGPEVVSVAAWSGVAAETARYGEGESHLPETPAGDVDPALRRAEGAPEVLLDAGVAPEVEIASSPAAGTLLPAVSHPVPAGGDREVISRGTRLAAEAAATAEPAAGAAEGSVLAETAKTVATAAGDIPGTVLAAGEARYILARCHVTELDGTRITVLRYMDMTSYMDSLEIEVVNRSGDGSSADTIGGFLRERGYKKVALRDAGKETATKTKVFYHPDYLQSAFRVASDIPGYQNMEAVGSFSSPGTKVRVVLGEDMVRHAALLPGRLQYALSTHR